MSTATTVSLSHNDDAFFRKRKMMIGFPLVILPFLAALFWILGGGKATSNLEESVTAEPGQRGFNASVPVAKNGSINGRDIESPGYGKAASGQVLSTFTNSHHDSVSRGIKAIPAVVLKSVPVTSHQSSLATPSTQPTSFQSPAKVSSSKAVASTKLAKAYYYNPPQRSAYYSGSDQQIEAQLKKYEATRQTAPLQLIVSKNKGLGATITAENTQETPKPASIQLCDNLTASRLSEPLDAENAFHTAPTEGSRRRAEQAVLSSGNSYGSKKTVAWLIPVVIHDDQAVKSGNTVKLRLLKEVSADGITIPANTILHAICQVADDRLRMVVHNLQLGSQLIPLDLEVYDIDGSPGVNMPGLSNQVGGQLQSSAIQGVQLPGVGSLANHVLNSARVSTSNSVRQTTLRLRSGYNLYLKAQ